MENNAVLLDVRTPEEHKTGYLEGAVLLPLAELESKITKKIPAKNTPIYIYCRSGRRAGTAVEKLKAMGYTDLHNLGGLKDAREKLDLRCSTMGQLFFTANRSEICILDSIFGLRGFVSR